MRWGILALKRNEQIREETERQIQEMKDQMGTGD